MKSIIDSDCISASLCERELREKLKNIMVSESTYIGDTQWMQVPEPMSEDEIMQTTQGMSEFAAAMFKAGVSTAEKAHGIIGETK